MRLTLQTDYALRVLIYVALKREGSATIPEIVARFDMSKGHLTKVVQRLGQKGYLTTIRGRNGGLRLGHPVQDIKVGDVVRDMEAELGVLGCLRGEADYCRIEECCTLRSALAEATDAFLATLDRYTIADLVRARQMLARLLKIETV